MKPSSQPDDFLFGTWQGFKVLLINTSSFSVSLIARGCRQNCRCYKWDSGNQLSKIIMFLTWIAFPPISLIFVFALRLLNKQLGCPVSACKIFAEGAALHELNLPCRLSADRGFQFHLPGKTRFGQMLSVERIPLTIRPDRWQCRMSFPLWDFSLRPLQAYLFSI